MDEPELRGYLPQTERVREKQWDPPTVEPADEDTDPELSLQLSVKDSQICDLQTRWLSIVQDTASSITSNYETFIYRPDISPVTVFEVKKTKILPQLYKVTNNQQMVCKIIKCPYRKQFTNYTYAVKRCTEELMVLGRLKHSCIVHWLGGGLYKTKDDVYSFSLLERASMSAFELVTNAQLRLTFESAHYNWVKIAEIQTLMGLEYMHGLHFYHRDVKPENILLFQTPDGPLAKICDFGLTTNQVVRGTGGTLLYKSPETTFLGLYNTKSDIWSWCLSFWFIHTEGKDLFTTVDVKQVWMEMIKTVGMYTSPEALDIATITSGVNRNILTCVPHGLEAQMRKSLASHRGVVEDSFTDIMKRNITLLAQDRMAASDLLKHTRYTEQKKKEAETTAKKHEGTNRIDLHNFSIRKDGAVVKPVFLFKRRECTDANSQMKHRVYGHTASSALNVNLPQFAVVEAERASRWPGRGYYFEGELPTSKHDKRYSIRNSRLEGIKDEKHSRTDKDRILCFYKEHYPEMINSLIVGPHLNLINIYAGGSVIGESSVMTYMIKDPQPERDLESWMTQSPHGQNKHRVDRIEVGVLRALQHLHDSGVYFGGTLNMNNIFVSGDDEPKLCTEGSMGIENDRAPTTSVYGTNPFIAPEMLLKVAKPCNASDVWVAAGIFYYLRNGKCLLSHEVRCKDDRLAAYILCFGDFARSGAYRESVLQMGQRNRMFKSLVRNSRTIIASVNGDPIIEADLIPPHLRGIFVTEPTARSTCNEILDRPNASPQSTSSRRIATMDDLESVVNPIVSHFNSLNVLRFSEAVENKLGRHLDSYAHVLPWSAEDVGLDSQCKTVLCETVPLPGFERLLNLMENREPYGMCYGTVGVFCEPPLCLFYEGMFFHSTKKHSIKFKMGYVINKPVRDIHLLEEALLSKTQGRLTAECTIADVFNSGEFMRLHSGFKKLPRKASVLSILRSPLSAMW
ncbi:UNVERIFIED_CONTAM: hypothetical protein FKN15_027158 [Acipenser sinensis]